MIGTLPLVLLHMLCGAASPPIPEDEIRAMKMKDLRAFLEDRDVSYAHCVEKSDFIKTALAVKDQAISPEKLKLKGYMGEFPTSTFWKFWANEATGVAAAQKCSLKGQEMIKNAVESCLEQFGKSTARKLKKDPTDLLKTSLKSPYYQAGVQTLIDLTRMCSSNIPGRETAIRKYCESHLIPWVTNVGIENTNPMYEVLHEPTKEL